VERFCLAFEQKSLAELEQEALDLADDGGFEIGFRVCRLLVETQEFQHVGFFEDIFGFRYNLALGGEVADFTLIPTESESFIENWMRPGA